MYRKNAKSNQSIGTCLVRGAVRLYQVVISPWTKPRCRHIPTCSHYMIEAVQLHGLGHGLLLGIRRFCRCHPFNAGGFDPVPQREEKV